VARSEVRVWAAGADGGATPRDGSRLGQERWEGLPMLKARASERKAPAPAFALHSWVATKAPCERVTTVTNA